MKRLLITADGNYSVEVPKGRRFSLACSGTFGSGTVTVKYNTGMTPTAATGTLTGTTIAADDFVVIGDVTYTYVADLGDPQNDYDVLVGADDSASLDNLVAAINGAAGAGFLYGANTIAHQLVTATAGAGDTLVITSIVEAAASNDIATTAALTAGDWGAATLTGGTDPIDRWTGFATTALALTASGEKTGTNFGAHNEINLAVTGSTGAAIVAIVNVLQD